MLVTPGRIRHIRPDPVVLLRILQHCHIQGGHPHSFGGGTQTDQWAGIWNRDLGKTAVVLARWSACVGKDHGTGVFECACCQNAVQKQGRRGRVLPTARLGCTAAGPQSGNNNNLRTVGRELPPCLGEGQVPAN